MPGIGVRIWNPPYRSGGVENPLTVVNTSVEDAIGLDGFTFPFQTYTGHFLVRIIGRANKATRPLVVQVSWKGVPMVEQAFFVESGAGGTFVGLWTLIGQTPALGNIVITCGAGNAGTAAIRAGEISGKPTPVIAQAKAGYSFTRVMAAGDAIVTVGGVADAAAFPFTSTDFTSLYALQIPPKLVLPNRHSGLSAYFGQTFVAASDNSYDISTAAPISGVIGFLEIKL